MGNSLSSQSAHSPTSIRSRTSRKGPPSIDQQTARVSHPVSFYQTPPGSFDPDRPLSFAPQTEAPQSESSRSSSPSPSSSPVKQQAQTLAILPAVPDELPKRKWKPGVYSLINARSGTAADLHGGDHRSLIGYTFHGGKNQQWKFEPLGDGYSICSLYSPLYLTIEEGAVDGCAVVATPFPVSWKVERVREEEQVTLRILWPNNKYALELADQGSAVAGTKVQLAVSNPDDISQQWHLLEHDVSPLTPVNPSQAPAAHPQMTLASPPIETVIISEDRDYVTTTRTTTTSTVTTVTTVTKAPRSA